MSCSKYCRSLGIALVTLLTQGYGASQTLPFLPNEGLQGPGKVPAAQESSSQRGVGADSLHNTSPNYLSREE